MKGGEGGTEGGRVVTRPGDRKTETPCRAGKVRCHQRWCPLCPSRRGQQRRWPSEDAPSKTLPQPGEAAAWCSPRQQKRLSHRPGEHLTRQQCLEGTKELEDDRARAASFVLAQQAAQVHRAGSRLLSRSQKPGLRWIATGRRRHQGQPQAVNFRRKRRSLASLPATPTISTVRRR